MKTKILSIALATSIALSGCAQSTPEVQPTQEPFTGITIVASTNVWGDIAKSIGGDRVQVVSIIENFAQDPHSYEASARDQLAVNDADLIVANGGGYDSFIDTLAKSAGNENIVYAYLPDELAKEDQAAKEDDGHDHDHDHDHAEGNEHVWYDFHVVEDFASRLAGALAALDSEYSTVYSDNLVVFQTEIEILEDRVAAFSGKYANSTVVTSEPVADYLLIEMGLENLTPASFSQAIEEELDVSPKDLLEIQNLLKSKSVDVFVVNPQTGSVQIDALVELAKQNGVSVVELSELLPEGFRYFDWMDLNIANLEAALR
jgi:zinc/manganese transport system substrate-binding protein